MKFILNEYCYFHQDTKAQSLLTLYLFLWYSLDPFAEFTMFCFCSSILCAS